MSNEKFTEYETELLRYVRILLRSEMNLQVETNKIDENLSFLPIIQIAIRNLLRSKSTQSVMEYFTNIRSDGTTLAFPEYLQNTKDLKVTIILKDF